MRRISVIYALIPALLLLAVPAAGEKDGLEVLDFDRGAYVSRDDRSVWSSLATKGLLGHEDRFRVQASGELWVKKGSNDKNFLRIRGEGRVGVDKGSTELRMERGDVFAVLDGLNRRQGFNVSSPVAMASVRGTRFWVRIHPEMSEILTFAGSVRVTALEKGGGMTFDSVLLDMGEKVKVGGAAAGLHDVEELTAEDWAELGKVIQKLRIQGYEIAATREEANREAEMKEEEVLLNLEFERDDLRADSTERRMLF
ncbi:MAG: FecR domain-containing protein [Candidatus Omnitrophica bacterium]|nr:FecR domain-containing protein [Candidatus Omnitrophota bacterium]